MGKVGDTSYLYQGRTPQVGVWKCRACGNDQGGDPARGCPTCGAGTPEQAAAAQAAARGPQVSHERIAEAAVLEQYTQSEIALPAFHLFQLTPAARWTVAAALAHYADHGSPTTAELPRVVIKSWALELANQLLEDEAAQEADAKTRTTSTTSTTPGEGDPTT